jgi:gas vesicle protein
MNTGKLALGLLAAAATGALIGILFAPAKGAALRRKIQRMGEKEVDVLKDKYNDFAEDVSHTYHKVKENVVDFAQQSMRRNEEKVKTAENN